MRWPVPLAVLSLLAAGSVTMEARTASLTPYLQDKRLGAIVQGVSFPPTFRKDLRSGLTNRILIRVTLLAHGRALAERVLQVAIKYDLWEETYRLEITAGEAPVVERTYANAEELLAFLDNARLPALLAPGVAASGQSVTLRAELLLNPIDRERMERIRKWVAENSTPSSTGDPVSPVSNELFNRIFEQYASGTDVASAWQVTVDSHAFRIDELPP